jgi:putative transposase
MFHFFRLWFGALARCFRSRRDLLLENLAFRQQLSALKRRHPKPKLGLYDKLFWVTALRFWPEWKRSLMIVTPETVVRWHRTGFRRYWSLVSGVRNRVGRKKFSKDVQDLIFRLVAENPSWGAPRIHGELLMLGFDISERSVSRWMKRAPRDPEPGRRWLAFLRNHREAIAAMDFFTVPTITFGLLYCDIRRLRQKFVSSARRAPCNAASKAAIVRRHPNRPGLRFRSSPHFRSSSG